MRNTAVSLCVWFFSTCLLGAQEPAPTPGVVTPMPPEGLSVGPATKAPSADPAEPGMEAAVAGLLQAFQGGNPGNPLAKLGGGPVVDFRELKALLPGEMSGLRRSGARGEKSGFMGAEVSVAEGDYGAPDGPRFKVKITDLGGIGALGRLAGMAWMGLEVDSEGDHGYERTGMFQGHKGHEKYDKIARTGSSTVTVRDRFLVEIAGSDVEPAQMKAAMDAMILPDLEKLAAPNP
jgi:hypothetical protein